MNYRKLLRKILSWIIIIAVCIGTYEINPEFFQKSLKMIAVGDIQSLATYLHSFGAWTAVILLLLFIILTFDVVFPFMLLEGAAGIIYGFFWGTLLSWVGEVAGALVMFFVARYFFRDYVHGLLIKSKYMKQAEDYSSKKGFWILLYARLFPLAPSGIITAVAAISQIKFRDFILATIIGKLPPIIIKVLMGHDLAFINNPDSSKSMLLIVIAIVCAYGGFMYYQKKQREKKALLKEQHEKHEHHKHDHHKD
ncbi:MAG: TVP38/TMEM64 family protein [Negativicutes bacterium]